MGWHCSSSAAVDAGRASESVVHSHRQESPGIGLAAAAVEFASATLVAETPCSLHELFSRVPRVLSDTWDSEMREIHS